MATLFAHQATDTRINQQLSLKPVSHQVLIFKYTQYHSRCLNFSRGTQTGERVKFLGGRRGGFWVRGGIKCPDKEVVF